MFPLCESLPAAEPQKTYRQEIAFTWNFSLTVKICSLQSQIQGGSFTVEVANALGMRKDAYSTAFNHVGPLCLNPCLMPSRTLFENRSLEYGYGTVMSIMSPCHFLCRV